MDNQGLSTLEKQLIRHEGERLHPYRCTAGKLSIGVGHNLDDKGITIGVSRHIFRIDLAHAKNDVDVLLDCYGIRKWDLSEPRYEALVNMAFCMGRAALAGFKKMFAALAKKDFPRAAAEIMNSRFGRSHRSRANELAEQMEKGAYR